MGIESLHTGGLVMVITQYSPIFPFSAVVPRWNRTGHRRTMSFFASFTLTKNHCLTMYVRFCMSCICLYLEHLATMPTPFSFGSEPSTAMEC